MEFVRVGAALLGASLSASALAGEAPDAGATYRALSRLEARPSASFAVEGASLARGPVTLRIDRGAVLPVFAGDRPVGALVSGAVRLVASPATRVEAGSLRRSGGASPLEAKASRLLLLFADDTLERLRASAVAGAPPALDPALEGWLGERLALHLERLGSNLRARLLAEVLEPSAGYLLAEADLGAPGVVTFVHDAREAEPFRLGRFVDRMAGFFDLWVSEGEGERPGAAPSAEAYEIDLAADGARPLDMGVRVRLVPGSEPRRVLSFGLRRRVAVLGARRGDGTPLPFVREARRTGGYEDRLLVVLPDPVRPGDSIELSARASIVEDAGGGRFGLSVAEGWYPTLGSGRRAAHVLRVTAPEDQIVLASGRLAGERVAAGRRTTTWIPALPATLVGLAFGKMETREVRAEGAPPVVVFGLEEGVVLGDQLRAVGEDASRALAFLARVAGPPPVDALHVTGIPYPHGQGLPGLVHLPPGAFASAGREESLALVGHEVAHQWLGYLVLPRTYRDRWLAEGLAEYAGAWFAAESLGDARVLGRFLEAWRLDLLASREKGDRAVEALRIPPDLRELSRGSASGPLALGARLASSAAPLDDLVVTYRKGAWVFHMLRMALRDHASGSDARFEAFVRDWIAAGAGRDTSTADLRAAAERHAGRDLGAFFETWVEGTEVPRLAWSSRTRRAEGGRILEVRVRDGSGAPARVPAILPVRVVFEDGSTRICPVDLAAGQEVVRIPLEREPDEVVIDPGAVLAEIRRVRW